MTFCKPKPSRCDFSLNVICKFRPYRDFMHLQWLLGKSRRPFENIVSVFEGRV